MIFTEPSAWNEKRVDGANLEGSQNHERVRKGLGTKNNCAGEDQQKFSNERGYACTEITV
jgi:hypothetical protein